MVVYSVIHITFHMDSENPLAQGISILEESNSLLEIYTFKNFRNLSLSEIHSFGNSIPGDTLKFQEKDLRGN